MASFSSEIQRNYGLLRELDMRFHDLQKLLERQSGHVVQDVAQVGDPASSDALVQEHSGWMASVQKECLKIAEEKLALAVQTYELVDSHIQQLDADYRNYEEDRLREGEAAGAVPSEGRLQEVGDGSKSLVDPDEPTYCSCNQVSYGEMIACDNPECKLEWFHFGCVGIKDRPKGKWFCSECSNWKRRRGK